MINTPTIHAKETPGVKVAQAATSVALTNAFTTRTRRNPKRRRMIGITVFIPMAPTAGVEFIRRDFLEAGAGEEIKALLGGDADVVLSDMAANATGHRPTDHLKIMALAEAAADFAREVLAPGGVFLCKVLQGGTEATLLAGLKRDFGHVKHVKPAASRPESAELYLLATGFRGMRQPMR